MELLYKVWVYSSWPITPAPDISKEFVVPKYWTRLMTSLCTLIRAVTCIKLLFQLFNSIYTEEHLKLF